LLRYCLFLRSAPHHSEAKISLCTVSVLLTINAGANELHVKPNGVFVDKQSNRRARIPLDLKRRGEKAELDGERLWTVPSPLGGEG
jgi:hypothetical protein